MNDSKSIKEQIEEYRLKYDLYEQILCTPEENKLFNDFRSKEKSSPMMFIRSTPIGET